MILFLKAHMTVSVTVVTAIICFLAVSIPMSLWSQRVQVEPVAVRVLTVGASQLKTYQCGSILVGKVSIPQYCSHEEWPVDFAVKTTDDTFIESVTAPPKVGTEYTAYRIIDEAKQSYNLDSPKDAGFLILTLILAFFAAILGGLIAFFVADYFLD